ncbi:MAG: hypothetical protein ACREE6_17550, partial [Limisphaerales bacterium]
MAAVMLTASGFVFLRKPSAGRAAWLALFAILSVQVLYHNVVLVAAVCFGAWAVCWRRGEGRAAVLVLIVALVSAASLVPYASILGNLTSSNPASLMFRTGATMRRFIGSCKDTFGYPRWGYMYVWAALAAMIIIRAWAGLWRKASGECLPNDPENHLPGTRTNSGRPADLSARVPLRHDHAEAKGEGGETGNTAGSSPTAGSAAVPMEDFGLFAAVTLLFSAIAFAAFFWRAQMPMQSWYLLPFLASAVVCFDGGRPIFPGLLRFVFIGLVAGTGALSGLTTFSLLDRHFSDVKMFANELAQKAGPRDYILVYPWNYGITFNYYYKGAADWNTVPPLSDHSIHRVDLVLARMEDTNALGATLKKISQTLESGHRVWFLSSANWPFPQPPGTPPRASPPPPPLKYYGWSEIPYSAAWGSQTLQFLIDHSARFRQKYSSLGNYRTENMDLYVAEGWRTNFVKK